MLQPEGEMEDAQNGDGSLNQNVEYTASPVFQYTCDKSTADENPFSPSSSYSISSLSALKVVGKSLYDPSLTKIYTMDVCYLKGAEANKVLVAAGGHGGYISVYGTNVEEESIEAEDGSETEACHIPLMGWKSSTSWVSGVSFLTENPMFLLSTSNDGRLVIWDISKQSSSSTSLPPMAGELISLHSKGIFSMDLMEDVVATASKDSSVSICRINEAGHLINEGSITSHHSGAIRGVCFGRSKDSLADCGADGRICILDRRTAEPCTLTIESDHSTGVNTVQWAPLNDFLLLSASKDPALLLYDIRNPTVPVHRLQGHTQINSRTCNQIYRPAFVDNGTAVATPGQGSKKISIYSVEKGQLISQGMVGYDANMALSSSGYDGKERLWVAAKQINQLCPVRLLNT
ncbi:hypothetical protein H6P81_018754 [Aristolochia fimbriata]|uniref:Uncharacterized protein n=1 Tax=Aristolochia fimbriata TaxID=158543 RepID=A0AAV7E450_ARIFI|nr:hypothetical protein H6P81_018754 [Aristolochia fimbriata]